MPLTPPVLDNRTFEELLRDARLRIPQYNPEWTDFNDSDPGITLLQLFAWLTEMMFVQMNRLPDLNYVKFLQMLGMELKPAQPSTAHLTLTPDGKTGVVSLPQYTRVEATPPGGTPITFEMTTGVDVVATPLAAVGVFDTTRFVNVTAQNDDLRSETFRPFGWQAKPGSMLYLGFANVEDTDLARFPNRQIFPPRISLRIFKKQDASAGEAASADIVRNPPPKPVTLVWEAFHADLQRWLPLTDDDKTYAFQREGYIYISAPPRPVATTEPQLSPDPMFWLRCRLDSGNYPSGHVPEIDFIRANVVEVESLTTMRNELVGISEGRPSQRFTLSRIPVQPNSLALVVRRSDTTPNPGDDDSTPWEQVNDLLAQGRYARCYTLNATTGEIRFGDGINGLVPPAGLEIVAQSYRYGGGRGSNVSASTIVSLTSDANGAPSLTVTNERAAVGGKDEETVEEKMKQAPNQLRSRDRAVSAEDFQTLAKDVGGVAKAIALPLTNPHFPGVPAPGAVTVVIVPEGEEDNASGQNMPPRPSSDLIEAVIGALDSKRPIATELYVKGPEYRKVTVEATVEVNPMASFGAVRDNILTALRKSRVLDPYQQRFGQDFYPTNLYSIILGVADVRAVRQLNVWVDGSQIDPVEMSQPYRIDSDGLVYGADHVITPIAPPEGEP
ncbi:MAG: putative baseplate assembly protein [Anaerolineae bacterium]